MKTLYICTYNYKDDDDDLIGFCYNKTYRRGLLSLEDGTLRAMHIGTNLYFGTISTGDAIRLYKKIT